MCRISKEKSADFYARCDTPYQRDLSRRKPRRGAALAALAGSLDVTNADALAVLDALPGDIALYDDASHVGMVVGRDSAGKLLICHCSSGRNNVVVTEFAASGFTVLGRPNSYPQINPTVRRIFCA